MLSSPVKLGNYHLTGCTSDFKTAAMINKFPFCYCLLGQTKLCHHPLPSTTTHHHHPPPPTTSQNISTTTHHHHHQQPSTTTSQNISTTTTHHHPPRPTTSQNISTITHHQPKYIHHQLLPPTDSQNFFHKKSIYKNL